MNAMRRIALPAILSLLVAGGTVRPTSIAAQASLENLAEVYVVNADGSDLANLTGDAMAGWYPSWSPDGTRLAFVRGPYPDAALAVMNADGSGQARLADTPGDEFRPAWSPDGTRIAFFDGYGFLYVVGADGSGLTELAPVRYADGTTYTFPLDQPPAWSPDGTRIAFVSQAEVWVVHADGSGLARLTDVPGEANSPAWSPDGATIAYVVLELEDDPDQGALVTGGGLYLVGADGSNPTRLTDIPAEPGIAWSPDGAKILFAPWWGFGPSDIYAVDADGSNLVNLTGDDAFDWLPAWSPDGRRIAYSSDRGSADVYVVNADGSGKTRLASTELHDQAPVWSPDGTKIAFGATPVYPAGE
jgi:Tol biopolymer transport system component